MKRISHKELLSLIHYDPETGIWTRISNRGGRGWKHEQVGYTMPLGYLRIKVGGQRYLANVLAWFYTKKRWPKRIVDHKDNDKTNGKWNNLRLATRRQNRVNSKCRKDNKSGFKGVHALKNGKFSALIRTNDSTTCLGYFDCPIQANAAYLVEAKKRYDDFARAQ